MDGMMRLKFELAKYDVIVRYFSDYTTRKSFPLHQIINI